MFLSSKKLEGTNTKGGDVSYECLFPLEVFWELEKMFKELEYLMASSEDPVRILELNHRIIKKVASYVVLEKERIQLKEKLHGPAQT